MADGRTKEGQEQVVVEQVKTHGGFSIFWITDSQKRACAAMRLVDAGKIARDKNKSYPWCSYRVAE